MLRGMPILEVGFCQAGSEGRTTSTRFVGVWLKLEVMRRSSREAEKWAGYERDRGPVKGTEGNSTEAMLGTEGAVHWEEGSQLLQVVRDCAAEARECLLVGIRLQGGLIRGGLD